MTDSSIQSQPIVVHGWPLVEINFRGPATEQQVQVWLDQMNGFLARGQVFGLLTKTDEASDFTDTARKAMGLWFKSQREAIARWCVGVSRIAPKPSAVERLAGPKMQAAMPCPIFASADAAEARAWIEQRLAEV